MSNLEIRAGKKHIYVILSFKTYKFPYIPKEELLSKVTKLSKNPINDFEVSMFK